MVRTDLFDMSRLLGLAAALGVGVLCLGAFALLPGPHHALFPRAEGLSPISPGLWIDDPARAAEAQDVTQKSREIAAAFHGTAPLPDRIVFCTTQPCADRFNIYARGLSYGGHLILLAPEGINQTILAHELSHIALRTNARWFEDIRPRFPSWFDEGLAIHVSPDPRYIQPERLEDAAWVLGAHTRRDWGRLVTAENYPQVYGSAARLVQDIATRLGPDDFSAFVQDVANGADFDTELRRRVDWPLDP